jgi:RNA polymerase sigma-70 factor (ECF subfamily)
MKNSKHKHDSDIELIQQVAEGDEHAYEHLVKKYQHSVFNTIYRYIGDYDDLEDVAQEVFVKVWRYAKNFKRKSKFSTWLYRISVNQCLNYRSKHKKRHLSLDELTEKEKVPKSLIVEVDYEKRQKAEIVRKAVNELPERQRIALILSKFEEKSYKEIAEIMGVSLSAVESLIFRAKEFLKKKLLPMRKNVNRKFFKGECV